jgi:Zn-finger nucleic acid-binding protein
MSLPNRGIYCPNCDIKCKRVKLEANLPGRFVELDQCYWCGGIWADKLEMQMVSSHEARKIDNLDRSLILNENIPIKREVFCPRGGSLLVPLYDPTFPKNLHVDVCMYCGGIWMARGILAKYKEEVHKKETKKMEAEKRKRELLLEMEDFERMANSMKGISSLGVLPGIIKSVSSGPVYETRTGAQNVKKTPPAGEAKKTEPELADPRFLSLPSEAQELLKAVPEAKREDVYKMFVQHYADAPATHRKGVHVVYNTMGVLETIVNFLGGKKKK